MRSLLEVLFLIILACAAACAVLRVVIFTARAVSKWSEAVRSAVRTYRYIRQG